MQDSLSLGTLAANLGPLPVGLSRISVSMIPLFNLGQFQVGSYGYRSLIEGLYTVIEALWKPYIP